jgi:hypothetical protein
MGSDEKRDGFVIMRDHDGVYLVAAEPVDNCSHVDGAVTWNCRRRLAIVFTEKRDANIVSALLDDSIYGPTSVVRLSELPDEKSLGQVACESAPGTAGEMLSAKSREDWERVAQAVVEEHERRRR